MIRAHKRSVRFLRAYTALARLARRKWFWMAAIITVFTSNIFWLSRNHVNGDVAFYLYAGERMADGAVLYKDINDMNPPLIYILQMPAVWMSNTFHPQPHVFLYAGLWVTFGGILLLSYYLGREIWPRTWLYPLLLLVTFSFGIVNAGNFGQRDHLVAYAFLSLLLSCAGRIAMSAPPRLGAVAASCLAGVSIALKPYFIVPWLFLIIVMAMYIGVRRTARTPEFLAVGAIQILYATVVLGFFPQFIFAARWGLRFYSAYNDDLHGFIPLLPTAGLLALISTVRFNCSKFSSSSIGFVVAGTTSAFGFLLEAVLQHKAFPYHFVAFRFLSSLVIAVVLADFMQSQYRRRLTRINVTMALWFVAAAIVMCSSWMAIRVSAPLQPEYLWRVIEHNEPGRPILVLSTDLWSTFPMIYESGQRMALRYGNLWMLPGLYSDQVKTRTGKLKPSQEARYHLPGEMSNDEKSLFEEIKSALAQKPEIVYVQTGPKQGLGQLNFDFIRYISSDPEMARTLRAYAARPSSTSGQCWMGRCFTVLVRQGGA